MVGRQSARLTISGVFRISERGAIRRRGVRGRGLGRKKIDFGGNFDAFFISYMCNNRVQNPFSVPYNLLLVFEDDDTTNYRPTLN